jgi:hypothetical protein
MSTHKKTSSIKVVKNPLKTDTVIVIKSTGIMYEHELPEKVKRLTDILLKTKFMDKRI